jgi:DHA2 family multidrug resistance protein-like MFS transporter
MWAASFSVGAALGPLVGGILLQHFWWGSVFLISIPIMLTLLVLGPVLLPEYRNASGAGFDLVSSVLSLVAVLVTVYALKRLAQDGFEWLSLTLCALGIIVGRIFLQRQARAKVPMLAHTLFRSHSLRLGLLTYTIGNFACGGTFVLLGQYFQLVVGLDPLAAALWLLPIPVCTVLGTAVTPLLSRRLPLGRLIGVGLLIAAAGFALLGRIDEMTAPSTVALSCGIYTLGLAPVLMATMNLTISDVSLNHAGAAAALSETGAALGEALGIALLGSLSIVVYRLALHDAVPISALDFAAISTLGGALDVAQHIGSIPGATLAAAASAAFVKGMRAVAQILALGLTLFAIWIWWRLAAQRRVSVVS